MPVLGNVLESILNSRMVLKKVTLEMDDPFQFGFKANAGTSDNLFIHVSKREKFFSNYKRQPSEHTVKSVSSSIHFKWIIIQNGHAGIMYIYSQQSHKWEKGKVLCNEHHFRCRQTSLKVVPHVHVFIYIFVL